MNEIFNSSFETGLRILLLLSSISPQAISIDRITAYDFITIYGKDFDVSNTNMHGDSNFNFSELAIKRSNCNEGVKEFVLKGLIDINQTDEGFSYQITPTGQSYVSSLSSEYAELYLATSSVVHKKYSDISDAKLMTLINQKAIKELRRKS